MVADWHSQVYVCIEIERAALGGIDREVSRDVSLFTYLSVKYSHLNQGNLRLMPGMLDQHKLHHVVSMGRVEWNEEKFVRDVVVVIIDIDEQEDLFTSPDPYVMMGIPGLDKNITTMSIIKLRAKSAS